MEASARDVAFDQRIEQICISTSHGFSAYDYVSGVILYEARFSVGGTEHVALLSDSNLVAASGDGTEGGYKTSTVILWNTNQKMNKVIREIEHSSPVLKIFFNTDALVVVQQDEISFYNTANFHEYHKLTNPTKTADCMSLVQTTSASLMTVPSADGQRLDIIDFHDPSYPLCSINIPCSDISFAALDRQGELIAMAVDGGKSINLWSLKKKQIIAKYKRGAWSAKVTGIVFDHLSNYFLMTTKRGTMHVFQVPAQTGGKLQAMRSKYTLDMPKGIDFTCQFDVAGYIITCITSTGLFKKVRLDIEKEEIVSIEEEKKLDL